MRGATLKLLASVTDAVSVIKRHQEYVKPLALTSQEHTLTARVDSAYASASRTAPFAGEVDCEIPAEQFKSLAALFDDEDNVSVLPRSDGDRLILKGLDRQFILPVLRRPQTPIPRELGQVLGRARVALSELRTELDLAMEFAAEAGHHRQILTGAQLRFRQDALNIVTTNGQDLLFATTVGSMEGQEALCCVPPMFLDGLKVHTDDYLDIALYARRIVTTSSTSRFDSTVFSGEFPNTARLTAQQERFTLQLTREQLRSMVEASKAFDSKAVIITGRDGQVVLETLERTAEFCAEGTAVGETGIHPGNLAKVMRIGEEQMWQIGKLSTTPLLVTAGNRRVWCMPLYIAARQ